MHLSRLLLDVRSRSVQRDLGNIHAMHQRVMSGFPDEAETGDGTPSRCRERNGVLYRVEPTAEGGVRLLVQSTTLPCWDRLPTDYVKSTGGLNPTGGSLNKLLDELSKETSYRFRLRANATKRVHDPRRDAHGPRIELVGAELLLAWLKRKGEQNGFTLASSEFANADSSRLPDVRVVEEPKARGWRNNRKITIGSTLFEGRLVIKDPELIRAAVRNGIGRGRAYGFGLLSLAP